jgi:hypothetical protein
LTKADLVRIVWFAFLFNNQHELRRDSMSRQVCVLNADALVEQYVLRQSREAGGKQYLGYFYETLAEDTGGGWVYDFATGQHVVAAASHCVLVPKYRVSGGLRGVPVKIELFGAGVVVEEFVSQGQLRVRVKFDERPASMLVNLSVVKVVVPPRV